MKIFEKRQLRLKEDVEVEPSKSNANYSDISTDVKKAETKNPTATTFHVDSNNYNGNPSDNEEKVEIPDDGNISNTINMTMQKPGFSQLASKGQLGFTIKKNEGKIYTKQNIQEYRIKQLRENSVPFSKKEIKEILS